MKLNVVVAACLITASAATAGPISLSASIAGGTSLGAGTYSGSFDGTGLLPGAFTINSASYQFVFADDADGFTNNLVGTTNTISVYSQSNSYYNGRDYIREYERSSTAINEIIRTGEVEAVSVSLAGTNVGSGATASSTLSSLTTVYNGRSYDYMTGYFGYTYGYRCGNYTCSGYQPGSLNYYYTNSYTQNQITTQDWTGSFTVDGDLTDSSLLYDLLTTRQLQFGLDVIGDLKFVSGTLFLDVTETRPTDVPEPGSLVLTMGALAALGAVRWRRRRN